MPITKLIHVIVTTEDESTHENEESFMKKMITEAKLEWPGKVKTIEVEIFIEDADGNL